MPTESDEKEHKDDATSVAAWIMEMADTLMSLSCNPVLLYKPQGKLSSLTGIEDNDFILVIQTPLQAAMLKEFGKIRCYSWHNINIKTMI